MAFLPLAGAALGGLAGGSLSAAGAGAALGGAVGGLFGGGGRQTNPATASYGGNPNVYIPQAQPQMDVSLQNMINQQYGPAIQGANQISALTGGVGPAAWAYPFAQLAASNIAAPSWATQGALQGAESGAGVGQNFANVLGGTNVPGLFAAAQNLPQLGSFEGGITTGSIPQLQGALSNILTAGYDPQSQLYNRLLNQAQQQGAAANAASGVTGPYAANTTDQAVNNFMMNWQNQQLGREAQAAQTASGLGGQIGNLAGMGLNQVGTGLAGGLQGLGSLGNLGSTLANLYANTGALPYNALAQQSQNALSALGGAANIGQVGLPGFQSLIPELQSYLQLGQSAATNAGLLGNQGFLQNQQQLAGLGNALGMGSNLLFGSQGPFGSGGLIGPLTGPGGLFGGSADPNTFMVPGSSTPLDLSGGADISTGTFTF